MKNVSFEGSHLKRVVKCSINFDHLKFDLEFLYRGIIK